MLNNCSAVFFDMDGTLVDPRLGISRAFDFALRELARPPLTAEQQALCVGPPLRESFRWLLGDESLIERGVQLYREEYRARGMYEHALYPGVIELLGELKEQEFTLFVLTAKMEEFAREIASHLQIHHFFLEIFGAAPDGSTDNKGVRLQQALGQLEFHPEECVIVGDRRNDIEAAKMVGAFSIGAGWGYGSEDELREADYFAHTPFALREILLPEIPFSE